MVPDATPLRRRQFGIALLAALSVPASGCLGDDDDDSDDGSADDDGADDGTNDASDGGDDDDTTFDTTVLWVTALDEDDGEPVPEVVVTVENDDYEEEKETPSNGAAFFDLEAGEYAVTAETEAGSAEETVELEEGDDGEVELEVPVPDEDDDFDIAERHELWIFFENEDGDPVSEGMLIYVEGEGSNWELAGLGPDVGPADDAVDSAEEMAEYAPYVDGLDDDDPRGGFFRLTETREGTYTVRVEPHPGYDDADFEPIEETITLEDDYEDTWVLEGMTGDDDRERDEE